MNYKTKRIVTLGLLVALEVVLSRFLSISGPTLKIGFAFLPLSIAGILYGPLWAGASGALADLLGALLFPIGPYFPGFTLTQFLAGMTYGFFLHNKKFRMSAVNAASGIVNLVLNLGLDSLWLYIIMGPSLAVMMPARALKSVVMVFVQSLLISLFMGLGKPVIRGVTNDYLDSLRMKARRFFAGEDGAEKRKELSARITEAALGLADYRAAQTVFCFVGTERELDTEAILTAAFADGKRVCVPLTEKDGIMTARRIHSLADLTATGSFGILEPEADAEIVDSDEIDIAFVPCSAADKRHNRIGKGGGYYDRYLAGTAMRKAALCPSALIVQRLPVKPDDVPVDVLVTENGVW